MMIYCLRLFILGGACRQLQKCTAMLSPSAELGPVLSKNNFRDQDLELLNINFETDRLASIWLVQSYITTGLWAPQPHLTQLCVILTEAGSRGQIKYMSRVNERNTLTNGDKLKHRNETDGGEQNANKTKVAGVIMELDIFCFAVFFSYLYGTDLFCPSHPPSEWLKTIFLS